jgi:hypothetical protein
MGRETKRGGVPERKCGCLKDCAVAAPVEGIWMIPLQVNSACDGNENGDFRSVGEIEGKLLAEGEEGGGGNSHCHIVWRCAGNSGGAAVAVLHLKRSQYLRPAAGQIVRGLAGGQTAGTNYMGAIIN